MVSSGLQHALHISALVEEEEEGGKRVGTEREGGRGKVNQNRREGAREERGVGVGRWGRERIGRL